MAETALGMYSSFLVLYMGLIKTETCLLGLIPLLSCCTLLIPLMSSVLESTFRAAVNLWGWIFLITLAVNLTIHIPRLFVRANWRKSIASFLSTPAFTINEDDRTWVLLQNTACYVHDTEELAMALSVNLPWRMDYWDRLLSDGLIPQRSSEAFLFLLHWHRRYSVPV